MTPKEFGLIMADIAAEPKAQCVECGEFVNVVISLVMLGRWSLEIS